MESRAYIKNLRIAPRKLRIMLPSIKTMGPARSLEQLSYTPKKGARVLYKAIRSAIANAVGVLKTSEDMLQFKLLTVEEGSSLKRFKAGGRGTGKAFKHRLSHIRIALEKKKEEEKKEVKSEILNPKSEIISKPKLPKSKTKSVVRRKKRS